MPPGEGGFIDLENGEHIRIFEHARVVMDSPRRFRIHPSEVQGYSVIRDRRAILRLTLSRGFVRVRAHKGEIVMEYDSPESGKVLTELRKFLQTQGFVASATIKVNNLHGAGESRLLKAEDFLAESGERGAR